MSLLDRAKRAAIRGLDISRAAFDVFKRLAGERDRAWPPPPPPEPQAVGEPERARKEAKERFGGPY